MTWELAVFLGAVMGILVSAAIAVSANQPVASDGPWVITDGRLQPRFMCWNGGRPRWIDSVDLALQLHRQVDAERLAAECVDACRVLPLEQALRESDL